MSIFYSFLDGTLVHCRVTSHLLIYTLGWKKALRVNCLAQEHNFALRTVPPDCTHALHVAQRIDHTGHAHLGNLLTQIDVKVRDQ